MSQQHTVRGRATSVFSENGNTNVVYHATKVVRFNDKEIELNTGGWRTNTTKTRMNQASNQFDLGYVVRQKDYDWFVDYNGSTIPFNDSRITLKRALA